LKATQRRQTEPGGNDRGTPISKYPKLHVARNASDPTSQPSERGPHWGSRSGNWMFAGENKKEKRSGYFPGEKVADKNSIGRGALTASRGETGKKKFAIFYCRKCKISQRTLGITGRHNKKGGNRRSRTKEKWQKVKLFGGRCQKDRVGKLVEHTLRCS